MHTLTLGKSLTYKLCPYYDIGQMDTLNSAKLSLGKKKKSLNVGYLYLNSEIIKANKN